MKKKILITGGLGFIGSHTSLKLLENNYEIIVLDNLSNSKIEVKKRIKTLAKKDFEFFEEILGIVNYFASFLKIT